ncbi:IS5Y transposase [Marinomonas sp. MED121]|nr:IS5Y transposase [Marinomonas sp. MED121]
MAHQPTFADSEFNNKRHKTRKEIFLARMNTLMPWERLETQIEPLSPKAGKERRPFPLSTMFRIHCLQHWYNISDPTMEDAFYEIASMHSFADLSLDNPIPNHSTIMNFRNLLEKHKLSCCFLKK